MSNLDVDLLQELIDITIDSRSFCATAAAAAGGSALAAHLRRMGGARDELIMRLAAHRARADRRGDAGSAAGELRRAYAEMLERIAAGGAAPAALAAQLEEAEHRFIMRFEQALSAATSAATRTALLELLPGLRALHVEVQELRAGTAS